MSERLVNIGEVIVNGVIFDPKNGERLRAMDMNELFDSVPRLFDLLDERGIDFVLVGGIAMLVYFDGRNTQVIDLIISRQDFAKLPEIRIEADNSDFARCWWGELRVNFLFTKNELFEKVRQSYVSQRDFVRRKVPCATTEGLVLLKLFALPSLYRQGLFDRVRTYEKDVADLIAGYAPATEPLFAELSKHMLPSDIDELRTIVAKIETEISESKRRFSGDAPS